MTDPRVTVLAHPYVSSPESADEIDPSLVVGIGLRDALTKVWPTDAHLTAYEPVELPVLDDEGNETGDTIPVRLTRSAIGEGIAPRMVAMIGDVDPPGHVATPEWRADTEGRLDASGLAWYSTRNGYRVLATIAGPPFELSSVADEEQWYDIYLGWCEYVRQKHGVALDPKCKDWTRVYRLPNVQRDGQPARSDVRGIDAIPAWDFGQWLQPAGDTKRAPAATRTDTSSPDDARMRRARRIAERMPASIAGMGGDEALFVAANEVATQLGEDVAAIESVLADTFNPRCDPPWPAAKLRYEAERAASRQATPEARHMRRADERRDRANDNGTEGAASRADDNPAILVSRTDAAHILLWDGDDRGHRPVALGTLRNRIGEVPGLYIRLTDDKGRKIDPRALIEEHGRTFGSAIYDYSQSVSQYDAERDRVIVGYPMTQIAPREDPDVAAWLHALAGDGYGRLAAWIASCSQAHIERLAAALVFAGPPAIGKSLFACAIAGLWRETAPVRASVLMDRFNGDLARCPILFDDENIVFGSRLLSTKRFREVAQEMERAVELKGRERFQLRGALRIIIACNDANDLAFTDVTGPDGVRGVADRLGIIDPKPREDECKAALAKLRPSEHDFRVDIDRVVAHMAWIGATVPIPNERFIGSGGCAAASVLSGHMAANAVVFETLVNWIDGGPDNPWYANGGELCVDTSQLAVVLSLRGGWDLPRVRAALEPFKAGSLRPWAIAGRPRLWRLNWQSLDDAIQLDDESREALQARLQGAQPQQRVAGRFAPKDHAVQSRSNR